MIRLGNGIYLSHLNGYSIKVVYKGNNECEIYLGDDLQGRAPFDYVKRKLSMMEKRWNTSQILKYQYREFKSKYDQYI